ncbi:predicted protein [Pyrenophora tritici-repentis Pt-1C-BFP]|uniref:Uncharacterized protein n=1 Tax=Pyrenophora tritici-repentis (strain Pt-1C-BFP) TaxID=426418 RepID=B2WCC5_PYRTR|nr:uncharacterized protein PTRG_07634 [Pyrenophora tritici-repentis Pt-1C-BFP]EDU50553.1 predicted protein [Pyrenophora tritici-repentis Pt-1C-BFP]
MVTGEGSSATISCTHIPEPKRSYSDRNRELDDAYYDHISQENQLLSPLLSLPAEMREIIYDYSIDNEVMIYPTGIIGQKGKISALLWVCRQTRAETAKQFFSKTKFETETLDKLAAFAQCLEKNHRKELRTISLLPRAGWDLVDFIDNTTLRITSAMTNNDTITTLNQANSPFLRLPPEIRNRVYRFALKEDEISIYRQIHQETSMLYFSLNEFSLYSGWSVDYRRFAPQLGAIKTLCMKVPADNLCRYRNVAFHYQNDTVHYQNAFRVIVSLFTALETIHVVGLPVIDVKVDAISTAFSSILETNQLASPLLRLPSELRDRIYELVLAPTHPQNTALEVYTRNPIGSRLARAYLAPLSTCCQMRAEGFVTFYSLNTFEFYSTTRVISFAATIGEAACNVVKSVRLFVMVIRREKAIQEALDKCLSLFPGLENVSMRLVNYMGMHRRTRFKVEHAAKPGLNVVFE